MPESWDLLDAIRELVSREGWEMDEDTCADMEVRIAQQTGIGRGWRLYEEFARQLSPDEAREFEREQVHPFLRSRDAAALLEDAISVYCPTLEKGAHGWRVVGATGSSKLSSRDWPTIIDLPEPIARTLAALEAGHKLGLWPVKT